MTTSMLKPGILVSLKTSINGGVRYDRVDLDAATAADDKAAISRWETTRTIMDPVEHDRAIKIRGQAAALVRAVTVQTLFGLLCPEDAEAALDKAVEEAREMARAHNADAKLTRVSVYCLKGRIASSDEEAARGIASEVSDLLREMEDGIRAVDVKAVRGAADRARKIGALLDVEQSRQVSEAVEAARTAAKEIVKRIKIGGEEATAVLAKMNLTAISTARIAFLDLDGTTAEPVQLPVSNPRALDLDDQAPIETTAAPRSRQLDLGA